MDKFWSGLIILVVILALALGHVSYVDSTIQELEAGLELVQSSAADGDFGSVEEKMRGVIEHWEGFAAYGNAFLRGSDVESVTIALQDYVTALYSQDDKELKGEYEKLLKTLRIVVNAEKPRIENIF